MSRIKSKRTATVTLPAVERFAEAVEDLSWHAGPAVPLSHMTFWVGAGFSKAWRRTAPTTENLFQIPKSVADSVIPPGVERFLGLDLLDDLTLEDIRRAAYLLDMYEKYSDVRGRCFDGQNLPMMHNSLRNMIVENYERLCRIRYVYPDLLKFEDRRLTKTQDNISKFFYYLQKRSSGTGVGGSAEGLRLHFITTNYDFTIEEILDSNLGYDETIFGYVYRGFTPHDVGSQSNPFVIHDNWLVQNLFKLNGGFEIYALERGYRLDYGRVRNRERFSKAPIILLPSREQDYSNDYFQEIFPKAVRLLRESKILVIVGYSLPEDDALIRFILRQFAEDIEDGLGKSVYYIDPLAAKTKLERLEQVFSKQSNLEYNLYQGKFNSFVSAFLRICPDA
jgi:hypothetical protein